MLPDFYPPRQTIGSRLERWMAHGVLERALAVLNGCLRLARGRKRRPSADILDTQSVCTDSQRGPRGYDAGKKVPTGPPGRAGSAARIGSTASRSMGRKRVLLMDTEGLIHALQVVQASVQDR